MGCVFSELFAKIVGLIIKLLQFDTFAQLASSTLQLETTILFATIQSISTALLISAELNRPLK